MTTADQAFSIVRAFSEIGGHRTGTQGDHDTLRWLESELSTVGADVSFQTFPYHHFDAKLTLQSDGRSIDAEMLYYSVSGERKLRNPATGVVDAHADEILIDCGINEQVAKAKAEGHDGLVLGTRCPTGDLCAINRQYETDPDFPVVLVAEDDLKTVQTSRVDIHVAASIRKSTAANVIARFPGPTNARRIVVTTPISGWFHCAGERGCGLAIALLVSQRLSERFVVDLLLASGHELGFLGGYHLADTYDAAPCCVLHLGSCIANIDAQMTGICSAGSAASGQVAGALKGLSITLTNPVDATDANNWVGESKCWASKNLPMLSIVGQAPQFHTPSDLAEAVTTPELLGNAIAAISEAALALAETAKPKH